MAIRAPIFNISVDHPITFRIHQDVRPSAEAGGLDFLSLMIKNIGTTTIVARSRVFRGGGGQVLMTMTGAEGE